MGSWVGPSCSRSSRRLLGDLWNLLRSAGYAVGYVGIGTFWTLALKIRLPRPVCVFRSRASYNYFGCLY